MHSAANHAHRLTDQRMKRIPNDGYLGYETPGIMDSIPRPTATTSNTTSATARKPSPAFSSSSTYWPSLSTPYPSSASSLGDRRWLRADRDTASSSTCDPSLPMSSSRIGHIFSNLSQIAPLSRRERSALAPNPRHLKKGLTKMPLPSI